MPLSSQTGTLSRQIKIPSPKNSQIQEGAQKFYSQIQFYPQQRFPEEEIKSQQILHQANPHHIQKKNAFSSQSTDLPLQKQHMNSNPKLQSVNSQMGVQYYSQPPLSSAISRQPSQQQLLLAHTSSVASSQFLANLNNNQIKGVKGISLGLSSNSQSTQHLYGIQNVKQVSSQTQNGAKQLQSQAFTQSQTLRNYNSSTSKDTTSYNSQGLKVSMSQAHLQDFNRFKEDFNQSGTRVNGGVQLKNNLKSELAPFSCKRIEKGHEIKVVSDKSSTHSSKDNSAYINLLLGKQIQKNQAQPPNHVFESLNMLISGANNPAFKSRQKTKSSINSPGNQNATGRSSKPFLSASSLPSENFKENMTPNRVTQSQSQGNLFTVQTQQSKTLRPNSSKAKSSKLKNSMKQSTAAKRIVQNYEQQQQLISQGQNVAGINSPKNQVQASQASMTQPTGSLHSQSLNSLHPRSDAHKVLGKQFQSQEFQSMNFDYNAMSAEKLRQNQFSGENVLSPQGLREDQQFKRGRPLSSNVISQSSTFQNPIVENPNSLTRSKQKSHSQLGKRRPSSSNNNQRNPSIASIRAISNNIPSDQQSIPQSQLMNTLHLSDPNSHKFNPFNQYAEFSQRMIDSPTLTNIIASQPQLSTIRNSQEQSRFQENDQFITSSLSYQNALKDNRGMLSPPNISRKQQQILHNQQQHIQGHQMVSQKFNKKHSTQTKPAEGLLGNIQTQKQLQQQQKNSLSPQRSNQSQVYFFDLHDNKENLNSNSNQKPKKQQLKRDHSRAGAKHDQMPFAVQANQLNILNSQGVAANSRQDHLRQSKMQQTAKVATEFILTEDVIQRLKNEVKKQIQKKKQDKENKMLESKGAVRHYTSVMPYEMKMKQRQQKLQQQASLAMAQSSVAFPLNSKALSPVQQIENLYELRQPKELSSKIAKESLQVRRLKKEEEESRKRKLETKLKRDQERMDQQMCLEILRSSMSQSPNKRRDNKHQSQSPKTQSSKKKHLNNIRIESVDEYETRLNPITLQNKSLKNKSKERSFQNSSSDDDLDRLDEIMMHSKIEDSKRNLEETVQNPTRNYTPNKLSPFKRQPKQIEKPIFDTKSNAVAKAFKTDESEFDSASKENRHQSLENLVKEQKLKRQRDQKQKEIQESKKIIKLKSQLLHLQHDYFKGLQEFKEKKRLIENDKAFDTLQNSKKKVKPVSKRRKKSKKGTKQTIPFRDQILESKMLSIQKIISQQKKKSSLSPPQGRANVEYNLTLQRNSMPVMTYSPQVAKLRHSLQSPLVLRSYDEQAKQLAFINQLQQSQQINFHGVYSPQSIVRFQNFEASSDQLRLNTFQDLLPESQLLQSYGPQNVPQQQAKKLKVKGNKTTANRNGQKTQIPENLLQQFKQFKQHMNDAQSLQILNNESQKGLNQESRIVKKKNNSSKRRPKTSNLPFKIANHLNNQQQQILQRRGSDDQQAEGLQSMNQNQINNHYVQAQFQTFDPHSALNTYPNQYHNQNDERIAQTKNQILEKIQIVQDKLQNNFLRSSQNDLSQLRPLVSAETPQFQQPMLQQNLGGIQLVQNKVKQQPTLKQKALIKNALQMINSKASAEERKQQTQIKTYLKIQNQQNTLSSKSDSNHEQNNARSLPQMINGSSEVSQIVRKSDEDEAGAGNGEEFSMKNNTNENTTLLLRKIYQIEENKDKSSGLSESEIERLIEACSVIQRHFRGFRCRKIMREKLRIDKEFRILRQKYEVKSNPTSQQSLSSLAFSQSKPSNPFKQGTLPSKQQNLITASKLEQLLQTQPPQNQLFYQMQGNQKKFVSNILQSPLSDETDKLNSLSLQQYQHIAQSEQFYAVDDPGNQGLASVFRSPTIDEATQRTQELEEVKQMVPQPIQQSEILYQNSQAEFMPMRLDFKDSQMNVNLLKDSELTSNILNDMKRSHSPFIKAIIERDERDKQDESFMNEDINSVRSQMPIEEESPFIPQNYKPYFQQIQQQPNEEHPQTLSTGNPLLFSMSNNLPKNERQIVPISGVHQMYLDSPMHIDELSPEPKLSSDQQQKPNVSSILGNDNQQTSIKKLRDQSSNKGQRTKSGGEGDLSSIINYGEEEKHSKENNSEHPTHFNRREDLNLSANEQQETSELHPARITPQVFAYSNMSPTQQHITSLSNYNKGRKDDSLSINTSIFEKNSFQTFTKEKQSKNPTSPQALVKAESEIELMINDLNKALKQKVKQKKQELQEGDLSVRTYNRRKLELDKWVEREKKEIKMTKKHFMQGYMRLSSLLDNFVQDQDRIKDAVNSIRRVHQGIVGNPGVQKLQDEEQKLRYQSSSKKHRSFDSEVNQQQNDEGQQRLFGGSHSLQDQSEYNTVSARRLSSGYNSSFYAAVGAVPQNEYVVVHSGSDEDQIISTQNDEDRASKPFTYLPVERNQTNDDNSLTKNVRTQNSDSEEEKVIEVKAKLIQLKHARQQISKKQDHILEDLEIEDDNITSLAKQQASGTSSPNKESSSLRLENLDSDVSKENIQIEQLFPTSKLSSLSLGDPEASLNHLQLSDTPINQNTLSIQFPDSIKTFEEAEKQQDEKVDQLVEEILQHILLRDIKERLFPRRPLSKLMSQLAQQKSSQSSSLSLGALAQPERAADTSGDNHEDQSFTSVIERKLNAEARLDEQIKVLDNILNDLGAETPVDQLDKSDASSRNSPDPLEELSGKNIFEEFVEPRASSQHQEEHKEREELAETSPSKKGIETGVSSVGNYMQEIFERLKTDKQQMSSVLENVSQPLYKDPLMILGHLQNSIPEPPVYSLETEDPNTSSQPNPFESQVPYQQSVLSVDLYLDIEKERRGGLSISQMRDSFNGEDSNSQSFINEMENIHNKAIFDAVNEALDGFRPYGLRGPPLPWSKNSKTLTFKFGKEETFDFLLQKVNTKVMDWTSIQAGTLGRAVLNEQGKPRQMTQRERDFLELKREERLARILIQEAEENEALWTDYEYEETQAKIDLADIVLEELCGEIVQLLSTIKTDRVAVPSQKKISMESKEENFIGSQRTRNDQQVEPYQSSSFSQGKHKSVTETQSPAAVSGVEELKMQDSSSNSQSFDRGQLQANSEAESSLLNIKKENNAAHIQVYSSGSESKSPRTLSGLKDFNNKEGIIEFHESNLK